VQKSARGRLYGLALCPSTGSFLYREKSVVQYSRMRTFGFDAPNSSVAKNSASERRWVAGCGTWLRGSEILNFPRESQSYRLDWPVARVGRHRLHRVVICCFNKPIQCVIHQLRLDTARRRSLLSNTYLLFQHANTVCGPSITFSFLGRVHYGESKLKQGSGRGPGQRSRIQVSTYVFPDQTLHRSGL
jgi:hypothetical protein